MSAKQIQIFMISQVLWSQGGRAIMRPNNEWDPWTDRELCFPRLPLAESRDEGFQVHAQSSYLDKPARSAIILMTKRGYTIQFH